MKYEEIQAVNWSTLKLLQTSPRFMRYRQEHPREDTKSLRLGRLIHAALLEPERFAAEFIVEPNIDVRTNAGKAQRAEWLVDISGRDDLVPMPSLNRARKADKEREANIKAAAAETNSRIVYGSEDAATILGPGFTVMKADEAELVARCVDAVRAHKTAREWLSGGRGEEVLTWTDEETGVDCKARLDFISPVRVSDVKSTRQPTIRQMTADVAKFLYHGQIAFYHDGAVACRKVPRLGYKPPAIIMVQTVEPFDVVPFFLPPPELSAGRGLYRSLLRILKDCRESEWWPGLAPGPMPLELPRWAPDGEDREETGDGF